MKTNVSNFRNYFDPELKLYLNFVSIYKTIESQLEFYLIDIKLSNMNSFEVIAGKPLPHRVKIQTCPFFTRKYSDQLLAIIYKLSVLHIQNKSQH